MKKAWHDKAWAEYEYWQEENRRMVKKINVLLKDIERNGAEDGIGKPERLKGDLSDFYSRRIDGEHRLVYRITEEGFLEIASCKGHYE